MNSCICTCILRAIRDFDTTRLRQSTLSHRNESISLLLLFFAHSFSLFDKKNPERLLKYARIFHGITRDSHEMKTIQYSTEIEKKTRTMKSLIWRKNGGKKAVHITQRL